MGIEDSRPELAETLLAVWRQALLDGAKGVTLAGKVWPVRHTAKRGLCQVDFECNGELIRGLQQNLQTDSRWALLARQGAKIMQFLSAGRYIANVADGKVTFYVRAAGKRSPVRPQRQRAAK